MFAGCDGCTVSAEHQRQQRWQIYVWNGPPHKRYAWFAMPTMFGASAAEVWWLPINSWDFRGLGSVTVISLTIPIFYHQDLCALLKWKLAWDTKSLLAAAVESAGNTWLTTVHLKSIDHPQIEGKLTATPGGLTNLVARTSSMIELVPSIVKNALSPWKLVLILPSVRRLD